MKKYLSILIVSIFANVKLLAQTETFSFSKLAIENKNYFTCYRNPFYRFGLNLREVYWELGAYDSVKIFESYTLSVKVSKDSGFIDLYFLSKDSFVEFTRFLMKTSERSFFNNLIEIKTDSEYINEEAFSCHTVGKYFIRLNEGLEIYFEEKNSVRKKIFSATE